MLAIVDNRECRSRYQLTQRSTVNHIHGTDLERIVALVAALKEWGPAQVAEITGVSPALQRQWRKQRVLTPLTDRPDAVKRTRFNVMSLAFVWAARVLIDNGAGHKDIERLVNTLGYEILNNALRRGSWDVRAPVTDEIAAEYLAHHPIFSMGQGRPFFAFRNDDIAVGHPDRSESFFHLRSVEAWLRDGIKADEPEDVAMAEAEAALLASREEDEPLDEPEEEDEDDDDWTPEPPPAPLPPGRAAVVIDVRQVTQDLLERVALIIGEVYDDAKDERYATFAQIKDQYDALNAEIGEGLDELERLKTVADALPSGSERSRARAAVEDYRAAFLPRYDEVELRLDQLLALMKLHLAHVRAVNGGPDEPPDPEAAAKIAAEIEQLKNQ